MIFTLFYIDSYVYVALDPNGTTPYWWVIIVGMPIIQTLCWGIMWGIIEWKNRWLAKVDRIFLDKMIRVKWEFCVTRLQHWKMEMFVAFSSLYFIVLFGCAAIGGIFLCVGWATVYEYYQWILISMCLVFVTETFMLLYTVYHAWYNTKRSNRWIILNLLTFAPHTMQIIVGTIGLTTYMFTEIAWVFFVQLAITCLVCITRFILLYVDLSHRGKNPNEICYNKYFKID